MRSKDYWDGLLDGMFPNLKGRSPKNSAAMQIVLNRYWPVNPDMTISLDTVVIAKTALPVTSGFQMNVRCKVRVTHMPTGIWAESADPLRRDHANRVEAMRKLEGYIADAK